MDLTTFKRRFDRELRSFLKLQRRRESAITTDPTVRAMLSHLERLILHSGKRARPYVAWAMYRAAGGRRDARIMPLLVGLELFHIFCLVHDDIIDRAAERHGVATLQTFLRRRHAAAHRLGNLEFLSNGEAMLLGDLLYAWANEALATETAGPRPHLRAAQAVIRKLTDEVIIGQLLDVDTTTRATISRRLLNWKMVLKSARYSFVRPMQFGLALGGTKPALGRFCVEYGTALGLAFQMQDDLFDVTSNSTELGKSVMLDLQMHQHTIFTQYILDRGTPGERLELRRLFGRPLSWGERIHALDLFERSGSLAYGQAEIERQLSRAEAAVMKSRLSPKDRLVWIELIKVIRDRRS